MSAPALVLTAAGIGLGVAGTLVSMRMISSLLFGVAPHDPVTFAVCRSGCVFKGALSCSGRRPVQ